MAQSTWVATLCACALALLYMSTNAAAAATEEASLNACQNAVKTATATFVDHKVGTIARCLQAISTQMVTGNSNDPGKKTAATCVTQFRRLNDSRGLNQQLSDRLAAAITRKCDPTQPGVTHTLGDILGVGATVPEPLNADDLNAWCTNFGGSGSINTLQDWMDCIGAAADCDVNSVIAAQYPRVLDWLNLVRPAMLALTPPATDPTKITDAVTGLDLVKAEIDGPDNDNVVSLQCGGHVSSGTAAVGDVLSGKTFSNSTAGGLTGTMPNNGAANFTPGAAAVPVPAGYYSGGQVNTDASLVSGNIKSGATIFGVSGNSNVLNTSGATATAADMASGKTAYVSGSLVTGTVAAGSNVNGPNGSKTFTIPDGMYSGSKTATANDSNLVGTNIVTGVSIFGVAGTQPPSQPLRTGQTTSYGTGSDADSLKGDVRSLIDNGDGTITDMKTGLMWEKKDRAAGSIHNFSNVYTWSGDSYGVGNYMDGTITTTFLETLNAGGGFAGHTDWRIPNRFEFESIINLQNVSPAADASMFNVDCTGSCTVTTCSCTQSDFYWSSTTYQDTPSTAWYVAFNDGSVSVGNKSNSHYVRAVRGGS